jgi:hypothetical protein
MPADFYIITATGSVETREQLAAMIDCAHACLQDHSVQEGVEGGVGARQPVFDIQIRDITLLQVFAPNTRARAHTHTRTHTHTYAHIRIHIRYSEGRRAPTC